MISQRLIELKKQLHEQKEKLFNKLMTSDAFYTLWDRWLQLFEWLLKDITFETLISHLLKFVIGMDWLLSETTTEIQPLGYVKGVYGKTPYGLSYYDPINWQEALKRLLEYFVVKGINYVPTRIELDGIAETLGIPRDYVYDLACRIQQILNLIINNIICGFWICGISRLSPTTYELEAYVHYTDYYTPDYTVMTTDHASNPEALFAPVCGRWVCGFGRIVARMERNYFPILDPRTTHWIDTDVLAQLDRFVSNITGFKLREFTSLELSKKAQLYGEKMHLMYDIDHIVYSIVNRYETDPMKINAYIRFAYEYLFAKVKKHKPLKRGFQYVTAEEFERYLIQKWKKVGLNEHLLRKLIEFLRPIAELVWYRRLKGIW